MARMSIDDKLLRDPRVLRLARACGWSRRETVGALLDVFAVAYDRERDVLPSADIDVAAEREGFADLMFEVDLAEQVRGKVRIKGAKERIEYLVGKSNAGRIGGIKSGESRRNSAKQKTNDREARRNLPDPVPDLPPDPVPEDQTLPPARDPAVPAPEPTPAAPPTLAIGALAVTRAEFAAELERAASRVDETAPPRADLVHRPTTSRVDESRTATAQVVHRDGKPENMPAPAFDPLDPRAIGRLAEVTYRRVSDARIAVAAELKLPAPLPFPAITPSTRTRGFDELSARIREEGVLAPAACDRVVANAVKQARDKRSIDWLGDRLFGDKAWGNARDGIDPSARREAGRRDPQPAPPRPRNHDPPPKVIPRDQLAGPEQFAEARKLLAAVTSNDDDTPHDKQHRRRKAAT